MSGLCLAAGKILLTIPVTSFTLAWTHSIEKTRWEEDWYIADRQLIIREARIKGAGAGMEPPPGAQLKNGTWHYRPAAQPPGSILLTHSPYAAGYELCTGQACQPLSHLLPGLDKHATIELSACPEPSR